MRMFPVGDYVVLYRIEGDDVADSCVSFEAAGISKRCCDE